LITEINYDAVALLTTVSLMLQLLTLDQ